jgi:tetratricopeptide (TPR) repeat protein
VPPSRNEPCPCGSGRKYKHCCSKSVAGASAGDARSHYLRGETFLERGLFEEAAHSFRAALALRPDLAEVHNDLGYALLALGQPQAAEASCRRALALKPRFAAAIGNLANAQRAQGHLEAAIQGYQRVIALEPGLAEAHRNLGTALLEAGQIDSAIRSLERAVALRPDFTAAVRALAGGLVAAGRASEALPHYERLLARDSSPETLNDYGSALVALGRYEAAMRCFRAAIARAPREARLHANLAHALHCSGDHAGAIECSRRALELDPRLPEAHLNLGNALLAMNALYDADAAYRNGLEVSPDHALLLTAHAMAQRALGRLADAEASARRARELEPARADTLALLGSLAIDRGRFADAEDLLRQALTLDPQLPEALTSLMAVRKMTPADAPWREAAERLLARGLPVAHASNLHHALGKYHDDVGEADAAFEHHRQGNEIARASRARYDREEMTGRVRRILSVFDAGALAALSSAGCDSERPVFVVGMPRSGTTLTEQILASHPQVHGAGELLFWIFAADAERAAPPEQRAQLIAQLGRDYLDGLASLAPGATRIIDKLPVNFQNLGLIHAALPRARFIHMQRNALDTCLSIYFQGFSAAHRYATDFGDLAHYYREYRRLMAHWRATLPPQVLLEVRYEELVEDSERCIRRMLEHLGLAWDPRCLEFHRTERAIMTASNWQARQPLGKGSIGRWRRYERHLGPLREALGEEIDERLA